jgi:uracil-DNA glycosylase
VLSRTAPSRMFAWSFSAKTRTRMRARLWAEPLPYRNRPRCHVHSRTSLKEVGRDYPRQLMPKPTLESWAKQGVLLLNATLTVERNRRGRIISHAKIGWKEAVTIPTLERLSAERKHLVFMLWGDHAKSLEQHILDQPRHLVLKASHPSPLSVVGFQKCGHFRKANDYLSAHGIEPVIWTREP